MDEETKKAELSAADGKISEAQKAEDSANEALKTAQASKDENAVKEAESKVKSAAEAVEKAKADKTVIEQRHASGKGADEIIADISKSKDSGVPTRNFSITKEKFEDLNEKAKLFDQFSPVLAKLQKDPKLIEKLMAGDDPNQSLDARLRALEQREQSAKQAEVRTTIQKAVSTWPDFRERWEEIKPILTGLEASGISYADAVQRAYFAVNPDAAKGDKRLIEQARNAERQRGAMGGFGGGGGPIVHREQDGEYLMNDADKQFAQKAGVDPKLYSKHADHIKRFADL